MADDEALRARLDALRKSSALPAVEPETDETDELVDRFLRFRSTSPTVSSTHGESQPFEEGQRSLKDLLADIPSADQWNVDPLDEKNIQKLMKEAQGLLPTEGEDSKGSTIGQEGKPREETESPTERTDDPQEERDEDADADEALQQILDELDIEEEEEPVSKGSVTGHDPEARPLKESPPKDTSGAWAAPFELPSTPSAAPIAKVEADEPDEDGNNIVQLPSAPTAQPSATKNLSAKKSSLKKYTDEEIDSWCIICSDDATVRCIGCDGDLYCAKCWKEGHVGPDVGYEERLHRWVKFRPDRESSS